MPKDLFSFFKTDGHVSTSKPLSPSPKKVEKKSPQKTSPKKPPTPKKTSPKANGRKRSQSGAKNGGRKGRTQSTERKSQEKEKIEQIDIDDASDDDIITDTPTTHETKAKGKGKKTAAKKKSSQIVDDEADFESLKRRKPKIESSDDEPEPVVKGRKKKSKIEDSPVEKAKKPKKKSAMIIDSDSEEEVVKEKKPRKPRKKKEEPLIGVSDDDTPPVNPLKDAFSHAKPVTKAPEVKKEKTPVKRAEISAADFFGTGPVHRTERPSLKRKSEAIEIHDDDDFEKTLATLDVEGLENPAKKPKTASDKIASKMSKTLVEDTPVKGKNSNNNNESFSESKSKEEIRSNAMEVEETPPVKKEVTPIKEPIKRQETPPSKKVTPTKEPLKNLKTTPSNKAATPSTPSSSARVSTPGSQAKKGGYRDYMTRAGPSALGSKEIPEGAPNCLEGITFVITGVQESITREDLKSVLERYGAKVTGNVSKKTNYVITGREAGESKLNKAAQLGTKVIEEDEVFDLIRNTPGKVSKYEIEAKAAIEKEKKKEMADKKAERKKTPPKEKAPSQSSTPAKMKIDSDSQSSQLTASPQATVSLTGEELLWVDKYKPQTLKNVIGQQGDKSNAKKLLKWLASWYSNISSGKKPVFGNRWNDDGSGYRAALLSGPPGVGKTTTAHLVCKEAGFTFVEMNASDARSKKTLDTEVAEMLHSKSLVKMFGNEPKTASKAPTHCLVMDEVDGMSGNADRGGMAEVIALIKKSAIPIICICNDRQSMKVRSLANHCFDLRFQKPRMEQIKSAMMSIAFKEGMKIPPPALNEMIAASNQDVRQVIHNLSMWSAGNKALTIDGVKNDAKRAEKDIKIGPFDVIRKVLSASDAPNGIDKQADLFFHDYSMTPLFVQENYINTIPQAAGGDVKKHLTLLAKAADSIADGDVISQKIRSKQSWSLLPLQAIASSVRPGMLMRGHLGPMPTFPSWLGRNSTNNKNRRLLEELKSHMHLQVSCDREGLNMDYRPILKDSIFQPLLKEDGAGVPEAIEVLEAYDMMKEDFESLLELSAWGQATAKDAMARIPTKTKSAFTRKYNQSSHKLPYTTGAGAKVKRAAAETFDEEGNLVEETAAAADHGDESDDDISKIASIKAVKPKGKAAGGGKKSSSQSSKGKGKKGK